MNNYIEERNKKLIDDYLVNKLTRQQLSEKYHLGSRTVRVILKKYGIDKKKLWDADVNLRNDMHKIIFEEYTKNKLSRKEIAKKYNINFRILYGVLKKFNVKIWDLKFKRKEKKQPKESKYFRKEDLNNTFVYWYNRG